MTRERAKELLPVIQAYAEGKTIQVSYPGLIWEEMESQSFDGDPALRFRIKPEAREWWLVRNRTEELRVIDSLPSVVGPGSTVIHVREVLDEP